MQGLSRFTPSLKLSAAEQGDFERALNAPEELVVCAAARRILPHCDTVSAASIAIMKSELPFRVAAPIGPLGPAADLG